MVDSDPPSDRGSFDWHSSTDEEDEDLNGNMDFKLDPLVRQNIERMLASNEPPYNPELGTAEDPAAGGSLGAEYTDTSDSQFRKKILELATGRMQHKLSKALRLPSKLQRNSNVDEALMKEHEERQQTSGYKNMLRFREKLSSYEMREDILDFVDKNQVLVISGDAGCGKTTQVAQFILDDAIERGNGSLTKIVCTQPREVSAVSVAERVAAERAENVGKSVGYQIRLEKIPARDHGSIMFCTAGLLLQYIQDDPALRDFSHIILDEIDERNIESDFIITLLKQLIPKRPDLKVILLSATLSSDEFSRYYNNCPNIYIPHDCYRVREYFLGDVIEATGFRFPTDERRPNTDQQNNLSEINTFDIYLSPGIRKLEMENNYSKHVTDELLNPNSEIFSLELIFALLKHICDKKGPGSVLVFLPGITEITKLIELLLESGQFSQDKCVIYPLHSQIPTVELKFIFEPPPEGMRKIIIATSIAETSITVEDVVYVVDCGRTKLTRFGVKKNIETLEPEWISLANGTQRRGCAGRVQAGECYHLYSKARESTFEEYPLPEMLRMPMEQVILQAKILQLGKVEFFLARVMDPPDPRAIELSLELLRTLNALDANEHLTPLGYHLAKLPLDPRTGKMIIWASLFSCVEPVFAIAASLSFDDPFYCPFGKEDEANRKKLELGLNQFSDHVALAEALRRYERTSEGGNARRFCDDYFLSQNTLKLISDMKRQFGRYLCERKFLDSEDPHDPRANRNSNNLAIIKAIVCAGLYPNIATVNCRKGSPKIRTPNDGPVEIHSRSINGKIRTLPTKYLTYLCKQRSTAIYLHDTTSVSGVAWLFAAPKCTTESRRNFRKIFTQNSLVIPCETETAALIQRLQREMETLLEYKISHPGPVKWDSQDGRLMRAIGELLSQGYPEMGVGLYRGSSEIDDA